MGVEEQLQKDSWKVKEVQYMIYYVLVDRALNWKMRGI